jgi:hypothetical protein
MEATDNSQFIIIGKYWISKMILMSEPTQLYVTNKETNECNMYDDHKVFELLKNEGLDAEPLHEYFDGIHGITKEERIRILKQFEDWEKRQQEKKLMRKEDKY